MQNEERRILSMVWVCATNNNRSCEWAEGKCREGCGLHECMCVCVATYQKQFQLVSIARHQPQPLAIALLCSHFPLLCLSLSLLGFPLLLLQWATLFSSPHTRHKSMFDFHNNNSRREIRKAMRKKKQQNERQRGEAGKDTGHGTRDTGDRTQDIMFAPCLKFLPLVCVLFLFYTLFFSAFSCAAFHLMRYTFFVVSLRQMKCIKFRDMRGATQRQIEREGTTHYEYVGNAAGKSEQAMRQL